MLSSMRVIALLCGKVWVCRFRIGVAKGGDLQQLLASARLCVVFSPSGADALRLSCSEGCLHSCRLFRV